MEVGYEVRAQFTGAGDKKDFGNHFFKSNDDYEGELKTLAESHELVLRNTTKKFGTSSHNSESSDGEVITEESLNSEEINSEEDSDEDEDEVLDNIGGEKNSEEMKEKRLPTVKKELGTQKEIQIDNETLEQEIMTQTVLRLLVELAQNSEKWERVHQLLRDVESDVEFSRQALQARKRNLPPSSYFEMKSTTPKAEDPQRTFKKPKKKKKKKKLYHRVTTPSPSTTHQDSTTESSPVTSSAEWRLMAEKLSENAWRETLREEDPKNVAKVRYSMISKPRTTLPRHGMLSEKQRETLKTLNDQREALMLKSAREYSEPGVLHFEEVNTHQTPWTQREMLPVLDYDTTRIRDYNYPEIIQYSQLPRYKLLLRGLPIENYQNQFQDDIASQSGGFTKNHEYSPSGRDFVVSKNWQNPHFYYEKPWQFENERKSSSSSGSKWSWKKPPQSWLPWRKSWSEDHWSRLNDENDELEPPETTWQSQQRHQQSWPSESNSWLQDDHLQIPSTWSEESSLNLHQEVDPLWRKEKDLLKSKVATEAEEESKDKSSIPKITIKSWNSLTSDPATWPFHLSVAKPWPKDENGKSYNPNADLVRKLGLDKHNEFLPGNDPSGDFKSSDTKYKAKDKTKDVSPVKVAEAGKWLSKTRSSENLSADDDFRSWNENLQSDRKTWTGKDSSTNMQSVENWMIPADQTRWKVGDERIWNQKSDGTSWRHKMTEDWDENFGKQSSNSNSWPSKWKQFTYHRVTAVPTTKTGTSPEGSTKPKNAFIAVSAVSPPKYTGNEWRKNDIEETPMSQNNFRSIDSDHLANQLRSVNDTPISAWKKNEKWSSSKTQNNENPNSDPFENQLVDLKSNMSSRNNTKNAMNKNGTLT